MEERKKLAYDLKIMRYKCVQCGKCCSDPKTFVNLTFLDILNIKKGLNIPAKELMQIIGFYTFKDQNLEDFMEKMIYSPVSTEKGPAFIGLLKNENSKCIFLDGDNKCKIYDYRPKICRSFPFTFDFSDINDKKTSELDLIYTKKGIEYCLGISKNSPIIKKRKILKLITESIAEIDADHKMIESWNEMVKNKQITPKAAKYIIAVVNLDEKIKKSDFRDDASSAISKGKYKFK